MNELDRCDHCHAPLLPGDGGNCRFCAKRQAVELPPESDQASALLGLLTGGLLLLGGVGLVACAAISGLLLGAFS